MSLDVLHLLAGYAMFKNERLFALSVLVAFHGLLRTGELLALQAKHVSVTRAKGPAIVSLGYAKSGKRQGAAESVTIHNEDVCRRLHQWVQNVPGHSFLTGSSYTGR